MFTLLFFDNNSLSFSGRTFTFFWKQRSCFLPRFWMSLSFNSLRSIIINYYLCLYSVFKVHSVLSGNGKQIYLPFAVLSTFAVRLINASRLFRHVLRTIFQCKSRNLQASLTFRAFHWNALLIASVEMVRFELMTPCLQGRCSPNWATPPFDLASTCSPMPSPA